MILYPVRNIEPEIYNTIFLKIRCLHLAENMNFKSDLLYIVQIPFYCLDVDFNLKHDWKSDIIIHYMLWKK